MPIAPKTTLSSLPIPELAFFRKKYFNPKHMQKLSETNKLFNPSNAEATFVQSIRMQRFLKNIQTLSFWY